MNHHTNGGIQMLRIMNNLTLSCIRPCSIGIKWIPCRSKVTVQGSAPTIFSNTQSVDDLIPFICFQNWCRITECCGLYNRQSIPKQNGREYANSAPWRRDQMSSAFASRWQQCDNWKGSLFRNNTRLKRNKNPAWISPKKVRNSRKITKF
jgi:hypothetical protein